MLDGVKQAGSVLFALALLLNAPAHAQTKSLKPQRIAGADHVRVSEVAAFYGLGRDQSSAANRAVYKTSFGQLTLQADRREIDLNGVTHWLNAPVLSARSALWLRQLDVQKVIDPILRPDRLRSGTPVRTIVLDPGHGGSDRGTRGQSIFEKTMTLDLAKRVEANLRDKNLRVLLTRRDDDTVSLSDRVKYTNSKRADLFVSLHFNSGGSASGVETYCLPPAGAASTATPASRGGDSERASGNRYDDNNVWLAHLVQKSLLAVTGAEDRGVRRARFYVLRYATCPAILVEAGFLSNRAEEAKIRKPEYREQLAKAIAGGILEYQKSVEAR